MGGAVAEVEETLRRIAWGIAFAVAQHRVVACGRWREKWYSAARSRGRARRRRETAGDAASSGPRGSRDGPETRRR